MKPSTIALALFATVSAAAQTAPTPEPAPVAPTSPLSAEVAKELSASLPQSAPARPTAAAIADIRQQSIDRAPASQLGLENPPADPEVLELPKMTVKQQPKPRPRLGDHTILGPKAFNEELARKNLSALDRGVLNKFTLPAWLGGVSAAERAREQFNIDQKRQFMDDVLTIAKAAEQTDPANAQALRAAAAKP
ncbi:MAG TPA: hypothetical protein PLQ52_01985 [Lacunisphaera sp.]|jgi:hypothetical protein|nr:hypothetical protein [Lacunisphaera sp.]